jgi:hypothetical protein
MAKIRRFGLLALLLLILLVLPFTVVNRSKANIRKGFTLNLKPPNFVQEARAGNSEIGQYLDSEAGISAYYQSSVPIDLSQAKTAFVTIETETADYIIGSVPVTNYGDHFNAHVYVHKTGWIMAYYFRDEPVSKIIDIKGQTINTTLLKTVVGIVANAAGVPFTDVTYYNFRYPNATKMLFVAENYSNGNTFTIQAPSSFGDFEYSWNVIGDYVGSSFKFDGITNPNMIYDGGSWKYGILTASQFLPDVDHTIAINNGYGVLVIVYREIP